MQRFFFSVILALVLTGGAVSPGLGTAFDTGRIAGFFAASASQIRLTPTAGSPPAAQVLRAGRPVGYVFSTYDVSGSLGFSGKPIDVHVALALDGRIAGAHIVRHEEPILVLGIPNAALVRFVDGFAGVDIKTRVTGRGRMRGLPDAVAGASVSSGVIQDAIMRSARAVASARNLFGGKTATARIERTRYAPRTWGQLLEEGAVARRTVTMGEVNAAFGSPPAENPHGQFIDLYAALLTPPTIGQNLLRQRRYNELMSAGGIDDTLIMIAANGLYSFRGRAWRKTGRFDRFEIVQGARTFRLGREGYRAIEALGARGAPALREIAVFTLPRGSGFDPVRPWRIDLSVARETGGGAQRIEIFSLDYALPRDYVIAGPSGAPGRIADPAGQPPLWQEFWLAQRMEIAGLAAMLLVLTTILFFQDALVRRKRLYLTARAVFLLTTLAFLGAYAGAQLSVVNVVTFVHSLMSGFKWELFLLNPLVFILWAFVAVALLFWGRGVYCGWLCPFGALQELLNIAARFFRVRQIGIPWGLHERLWPIKYVIFLSILAISLGSITWAFRIAEVEPFKTAIILKFMRDWPFVAYALALLAAGLFIERFFCRYLCPLGAALAIPARLRMFEWLKRRRQCGAECRICAARCTVQAIHPMGQINPNECIHCLRCQMNYYDETTCRPLRERALRRAGRTTISIGGGGSNSA